MPHGQVLYVPKCPESCWPDIELCFCCYSLASGVDEKVNEMRRGFRIGCYVFYRVKFRMFPEIS